jgi:hypothetical protein
MPAIFLLVLLLVLVIFGIVRWSSNRRGEQGQVHEHPIDRDSAM